MAILHVLVHAGTHLSPAQIHREARRRARGLSQPTVYRTLEALAQKGVVQAGLSSLNHLVYQIPGHAHNHLVCRSCGQSLEFEDALAAGLYRRLEARSGYRLTTRHLTLFGLCPGCQAGNP